MKKKPTLVKKIIEYTGYLLFLIVLMDDLTGCSNNENKKGEDFYYSRGKRIELNTPKDSIGILLRHKINPDTLKKKLAVLGFTYIRSLSDDIVVVVPAGNKKANKKELIAFSMDLSTKDTQLIEKAGYITYQKDGKFPLIITNDLMAEFKKGVSDKEINNLFSKYHIRVLTQNPFLKTQYVLRATEFLQHDAVKASRLLAEDSIVAYAHPDFIMVKKYLRINPDGNPYYKLQWYHNNSGQEAGTEDADIDTDLAWNFTQGDSSTIIAIIDNGFDITHPDLVPNFSYNPGEMTQGNNNVDDDRNGFIDDILGWNFRGCNPGDREGCGSHDLDLDQDGHGTGVMGMAVAVNDTVGVIGSCPDCSVIPLEAGGIDHQDAFAFGYAKYRGAKIISCSWLYEADSVPQGVESAINDAFDSGITIFFAIDNATGDHCEYPRDISSLNSVIAISRSTNRDLFYSERDVKYNSGYGNNMDLLAPGAADDIVNPDFNTMFITTTDPQGPAGHNHGRDDCVPSPIVTDSYYKCWDGTSFATPLTAGVAGLILSLDPSLSPKQVQYLLQDCTDKIQPHFGGYSPKNGFSTISTATGTIHTHGYGRVNAYEAVKIAAPVTIPGGKGGVDIFLRDNYLDWGNTEQPSGTLFESTRAFIPFWRSEDIKVDAPPFAQDAGVDIVVDNNKKFDDLTDENPKLGERNRVYVRVRNRGYNPASSVTVKLHWVDAGLGLPPLPAGFWDRFPADAGDITVWHPLTPKSISNLRYSGSSVAGSADDDGSQIVLFEFDAPINNSLPKIHYCLMAAVSSPDDLMATDELKSNPERLNMDYVTSHYNNATHRNYIIDNSGVPFVGQIYIYNPFPYSIDTKVDVLFTKKIPFVFSDSSLAKTIHLKKGEKRVLTFSVDPTELSEPAEITLIQLVVDEKKKKSKIVGGLTYHIDVPSKESKK